MRCWRTSTAACCGPYWPPERKWVDAGYRGMPFPFAGNRDAGFRNPPAMDAGRPARLSRHLVGHPALSPGRRPATRCRRWAKRLLPVWGDGTRRDRLAHRDAGRTCLSQRTLRRPDPGRGARRAGERRPRLRRPPAGAQQLRKSRLPDRHRGRRAGGRQVLPARTAGPMRPSSRNTRFVAELAEAEIPAVPALVLAGTTLQRAWRLSLRRLSAPGRPRARARRAGRTRMAGPFHRSHPRRRRHAHRFAHRPTLDIDSFGEAPRDYLLDHDFIPPDLLAGLDQRRRSGARRRAPLLRARRHVSSAAPAWRLPSRQCAVDRRKGPHFVDFDDARMGPAIQDLWMLLSGEREQMALPARRAARRLRAVHRFRPRANCIWSKRCARCA